MTGKNKGLNLNAGILVFGPFLASILFLFLASWFPDLRLWGFDSWVFFDPWVPKVLFALGLFLGGMTLFASKYLASIESSLESSRTGRVAFLVGIAIAASYAALFILLRSRAHFLGDGYGMLSLLGNDSPIMLQARELGESILHIWVMSLSGVPGYEGALFSYQTLSITSGILFVGTVAYFSTKLFNGFTQQLFFTMGVLSGGYMLMYFGYVENYSVLNLAITLFVLQGLLVCEGKAPRWSIAPIFLSAVLLHFAGLVLLPAMAYLLIAGGKLDRAFERIQISTKVLLSVIVIALTSIGLRFATNESLTVQLTLIPLIANQFTVEGYMIFPR